MSAKRIFMLSLCLLFCESCLNAQEDASQKAKDLLKMGLKNQKRMSYKSTHINNKAGKKETTTIYSKNNQDGTNYRRYEVIEEADSVPSYLTISNNAGDFKIIGNTAIKANFQMHINEIPEQGEEAAYSLTEGEHRGLPCYIVTKKIQANEERFNSFIKAMPNDLIGNKTPDQQKELFASVFPTVEVYSIGKNDGFIWAYTYYNVRGKKIGSVDYGDVELNAVLDDNLFKIPDHYIIRVASTRAEYNKIVSELIIKRIAEKNPAIKKKMEKLNI